MSTVSDEQTKLVIGDNLRRYRGDISYSQIARMSEATPIQISRIERGLHMPGVGLLTRIAEALGVTANDLLTPLEKKNKKRA